jgi:hypothetical protein
VHDVVDEGAVVLRGGLRVQAGGGADVQAVHERVAGQDHVHSAPHPSGRCRVAAGRIVSVDQLATEPRPDMPSRPARNLLRQYVSQIRRDLGGADEPRPVADHPGQSRSPSRKVGQIHSSGDDEVGDCMQNHHERPLIGKTACRRRGRGIDCSGCWKLGEVVDACVEERSPAEFVITSR